VARQRLSEDKPHALMLLVPPELVERLDAWVEAERDARPGAAVSRASLIREALFRAVDEWERARPKAVAVRGKRRR
jgi:hypothetical protein